MSVRIFFYLVLKILLITLKSPFFFLLLVLPFGVLAQRADKAFIDSLQTELTHAHQDTTKALILDKLAYNYSTINTDTALQYAAQLLRLSQQLHWEKGIALAYSDYGTNYHCRSNHSAAIEYELKALHIFQASGNKTDMAAVASNLALAYMSLGNYVVSLQYDFMALKIYEAANATFNRAILSENIGSIYLEQKDYSKAMEYYAKALDLYKHANSQTGIARSLGNIAIIEDAKGNFTRALEDHKRALAINKQFGTDYGIQINLANVGYVYTHMHRYDSAIYYTQLALDISKKIDNKNSIAINLGNLGETYFNLATDTTLPQPLSAQRRKAALKQAIQYLEAAALICRETHFAGPLIEINQYLADANALAGDYPKAYRSLREHALLKDSVFSIQNNLKLAELENKRQLEIKDEILTIKDKELQISKLKAKQKQEERVIYIISIGLLLCFIAFILRSLRRHSKRNRMLTREKRQQQQMIREQVEHIKKQSQVLKEISHMQAHDVRGPVASILGLVQLFNYDDLTDPTNKVVIEGIASITQELDKAVKEVIRKENSLSK